MPYIAQRRSDGSFITDNGTYHVPNEGEWADQWAELQAQYEADPSQFEQLVDPESVPPTLEEAKADKLAEINAECQRMLESLTPTYPERELTTFDKQEAEARAYAADPTASTPLLSALAQARGVPLDELARRVLVKADAFAVASGSIIGQRQALEDRLDACTTVEDVQGITVSIIMPGAA